VFAIVRTYGKVILKGDIMDKGLLSVIAVCLVMITAKLYVPQVQAQGSFEEAVEDIVEDCSITGSVSVYVGYTDAPAIGQIDYASIDC